MELKACPFCGAKSKTSVQTIFHSDSPDEYKYSVYCTNENCEAEIVSYESLDDAVEKWNTRVNLKED